MIMRLIKMFFPFLYKEIKKQQGMSRTIYRNNLKKKKEEHEKYQKYLLYLENRKKQQYKILNKKGEKALEKWRKIHKLKPFNRVVNEN